MCPLALFSPGRTGFHFSELLSREKSMPKGKDYESFLRNVEGKTKLIGFTVRSWKGRVRFTLQVPLPATKEKEA